jgi:hypothetical protein
MEITMLLKKKSIQVSCSFIVALIFIPLHTTTPHDPVQPMHDSTNQLIPIEKDRFWLVVPGLKDAIYVRKTPTKMLFVHPNAPYCPLPKGLYYFQNTSKQRGLRRAPVFTLTQGKRGVQPFVWSDFYKKYVFWQTRMVINPATGNLMIQSVAVPYKPAVEKTVQTETPAVLEQGHLNPTH